MLPGVVEPLWFTVSQVPPGGEVTLAAELNVKLVPELVTCSGDRVGVAPPIW